jgi:hypothetical protein
MFAELVDKHGSPRPIAKIERPTFAELVDKDGSPRPLTKVERPKFAELAAIRGPPEESAKVERPLSKDLLSNFGRLVDRILSPLPPPPPFPFPLRQESGRGRGTGAGAGAGSSSEENRPVRTRKSILAGNHGWKQDGQGQGRDDPGPPAATLLPESRVKSWERKRSRPSIGRLRR